MWHLSGEMTPFFPFEKHLLVHKKGQICLVFGFWFFFFFAIYKITNAVMDVCFSVGRRAWLQCAFTTFNSTHFNVHPCAHSTAWVMKMRKTVVTLSGFPKPVRETDPRTSKYNTGQTKIRAVIQIIAPFICLSWFSLQRNSTYITSFDLHKSSMR